MQFKYCKVSTEKFSFQDMKIFCTTILYQENQVFYTSIRSL